MTPRSTERFVRWMAVLLTALGIVLWLSEPAHAAEKTLEAKAVELIEKIEMLAEEHAADTVKAGMNVAAAAVRAEAIEHVGEVAAWTFGWALFLLIVGPKILRWGQVEGGDAEPFSFALCAAIGAVGVLVTCMGLSSAPWVALFAPELALALRVIQ